MYLDSQTLIIYIQKRTMKTKQKYARPCMEVVKLNSFSLMQINKVSALYNGFGEEEDWEDQEEENEEEDGKQ